MQRALPLAVQGEPLGRVEARQGPGGHVGFQPGAGLVTERRLVGRVRQIHRSANYRRGPLRRNSPPPTGLRELTRRVQVGCRGRVHGEGMDPMDRHPQQPDVDTAAYPAGPPLVDPRQATSWPAPAPATAAEVGAPEPPRASSRQLRRRRATALLAATAAVAMSAGAGGGWLAARAESGPTPSSATIQGVSFTPGATTDVGAIVQALKSSVVSVDTSVQVRQGPYVQEGKGAGTGIVLDGGYILTNAHVVADATEITVTPAGTGTARTATLVGADTANDVAVLKVEDTSGLTPATLGNSDQAQVGDEVIAIGNALALEGGLIGDPGHRVGDRSQHRGRDRHVDQPDPDRRRDLVRQLGRGARRRRRPGHRDELGGGDEQRQRVRLQHRLRDRDQPRHRDRRQPHRRRLSRPRAGSIPAELPGQDAGFDTEVGQLPSGQGPPLRPGPTGGAGGCST